MTFQCPKKAATVLQTTGAFVLIIGRLRNHQADDGANVT